MSKTVCELAKNSREDFRFSLGEYKGHKFLDMRYGPKKKARTAPTKKGLAVSPALWGNSGRPLTRRKRP